MWEGGARLSAGAAFWSGQWFWGRWQGPRRAPCGASAVDTTDEVGDVLDVFYWVVVPGCKNACARASLLAPWPVGFTRSLSVTDDAVFYSVYECRRRYPCLMGP